MFALMFAVARMASAAWVGAAVLFVFVAVKQTKTYMPESGAVDPARDRLVAELALQRFPLYYQTGAILVGGALFCASGLSRRYLKHSRWLLVMAFLAGAAALMAYDWFNVYKPLEAIMQRTIADPAGPKDPAFETLHRHSEVVNAAQVLLTFFASLCLCLPGTRPEQPTILIKN